MKNIISLLLMFIFSFCIVIASDEINQKVAPKEKVLKLLEAIDYNWEADRITNRMIMRFRMVLPDVSDEYWEDIQNLFDKQSLLDKQVKIYQRYFTEEEVDELIQIFTSPARRKMEQIADQMSVELFANENEYFDRIKALAEEKLIKDGYLQKEKESFDYDDK